MRYLDVGTTKKLSVIGLGTWQFGAREWGYGDDYAGSVAHRLVRRAHELGVTLFDSAEIYGFGRSERILGQAFVDAGIDTAEVFVATKIFPVLPLSVVVQQRAVASARRLGVREIALYQVHQPNPLVRDRTTMRGMRALHDVGLVDEVGVSNYSHHRWQDAERQLGRRVLSNQVLFSLVHRRPLEGMTQWAADTNHAVIAYSPLAQGFLSGRYDARFRPSNGVRAMNPLFLPDNLELAQPLFEVLRQTASAHDVKPAQVALAWVIRHSNVCAIPGASTVEQLEDNVVAAEIELADDEFAALSSAAERFQPRTGVQAMGQQISHARRY